MRYLFDWVSIRVFRRKGSKEKDEFQKTRGPTTIGWTRTREWGGGFEKEKSFYGAKEEEEGGASFLLSTSVKASSGVGVVLIARKEG